MLVTQKSPPSPSSPLAKISRKNVIYIGQFMEITTNARIETVLPPLSTVLLVRLLF